MAFRDQGAGLLPPADYHGQLGIVQEMTIAVQHVDFAALKRTVAVVVSRNGMGGSIGGLTALIEAAEKFQMAVVEAELRYSVTKDDIQ